MPALPADYPTDLSFNTQPETPLETGLDAAYVKLMAQLTGYQARTVQQTMMRQVWESMQSGQHLLLEAGTGAGKTFGYLFPLLLAPRDKPIVVATGTIALQEQLLDKDIPQLNKALKGMGLPEATASLVKGRGNYICIHKLEEERRQLEQSRSQGQPDARHDGLHLQLAELATALQTGWDGDRATLDLEPPQAVWDAVRSSNDDCLGWRCPHYQENPYRLSREGLAKQDLIIANHALYFQDLANASGGAQQTLPEHDVVVFDEAHAVNSYAMGAFTSRIGRHQTTKALASLQRRMGAVPDGVVQRLHGCEATLLHWLLDAAKGRSQFAFKADAEWLDAVQELLDTLTELFSWAAGIDMAAKLEGATKAAVNIAKAEHDKALQQLQSLLDNWRWFMEGDASFATMERVNWVELDAQHLYYELRSTPLAINTLLQENLWEQRQAVLTSATLAVENRLDFARQQLGLTDKKLCNALVLPSPFNYKEQSLLYLPPAGALPDTVLDDAYLEQVGEHLIGLLEATQGRALVLFTSYERMNGVAQYLMPRLDYPMRLQGDMSRSRLVEWFKRTPNAVLLATASFWEGVDIPGEALSCVVIEKLPFFPPDDPVHQTQIERLKASGQDWFNRFVLPQAILRLKQGIGRLIRKQDDRGVIALLDPRLHSKAYGRKVLASLPPMRRVSTFGEVRGFFE